MNIPEELVAIIRKDAVELAKQEQQNTPKAIYMATLKFHIEAMANMVDFENPRKVNDTISIG